MNKEQIKVMLASGTIISLLEWQEQYEIKDDQIGKHFSLNEPEFKENLEEFGSLTVNAPLMVLMDEFRERIGKPVKVNSYNRTEAKQARLRAQGYKAATYSPHVVKLAVDIDTTSKKETLEHVEVMRQVSKDTGIPCRIGYKTYLNRGQTFIHVDVCPLYYAEGKPWNNKKHPSVWEKQIEW